MLLPEASDEGRDVAEAQADREICNRKVFDHCVPSVMSRQCGCGEAGGAGDRVGGVGGPGRRLWRWFDAGRPAISGHHATATGHKGRAAYLHRERNPRLKRRVRAPTPAKESQT
jgi:hypothetical protein